MYKEEKTIPLYAFEPDERIGNKMLRIQRNDSVVNYRLADFLVPHRKDYYFMAYVKQGSSRHWIDTKQYTLQPDTFYFTIPQQVHLKESIEPISGVVLSFTKELLSLDDHHFLRSLPVIQNPHNGHELRLNPADILFIEDVLDKILTEYQSGADWQQPMLMTWLRALLIYLSRLYTEQVSSLALAPDRVLLNKFLAAVDSAYASIHEVAAYADQLHVSAGHLSEVVKDQSGKPALLHIHERIAVEAKRLLFHSDLAIKEVAWQLGFEDNSYFNRFFKRMTDQTPVQYRDSIREMYH